MSDRIVRLRAPPAVGPGGVYATGHGVDDVVRTAATSPPGSLGKQIWRFKAIDSNNDKVNIVLEDDRPFRLPLPGGGPPAFVWGSIGRLPISESPIILTTDQEKQTIWIVKPIDNGVPDAFTIEADDYRSIPSRTIWYAGTAGNQVVFKALLNNAPDTEKPYWVITNAK